MALVPGSRLILGATMGRKGREALLGQSATDQTLGPLRGMAVVIVGRQQEARRLSRVTCPEHMPETTLL